MDWRKVNRDWINFSRLHCIYVSHGTEGEYFIKGYHTDEERYKLFDEMFLTRKEAQDFLDTFMKSATKCE